LAYPLNNVVVSPTRRFSPSYACAELLWLLSGANSLEMILEYAPSYSKYSDGFGIYGPRWLKQFGPLVDLLKKDPTTRRAVISLWRESDLTEQDRTDLPCTLSLQFLVRKHTLDLIVTMRSNDVWLGLPNDVFVFTCIQAMVAGELGANIGEYHHRVGSLHLYSRDFDKARSMWSESPSMEYHHWTSWMRFNELGAVLALERAVRHSEELSETAMDHFRALSHMAQDIVVCCARKWGTNLPLRSNLLEAAYAYHRGDGLDRQDNALPEST